MEFQSEADEIQLICIKNYLISRSIYYCHDHKKTEPVWKDFSMIEGRLKKSMLSIGKSIA